METIYEKPEVEIVDFLARETLAVITDEEARDPEAGVSSRDF